MQKLLLLLLFQAFFLSVSSQSLEKDQAESDRRIEFLIEKYSVLMHEAKLVTIENTRNNSSEEQLELSNGNGKLIWPCIRNSVQLYNLSMDFQDKVITITSTSFIF